VTSLPNPLRKLRDLWVLAKTERATPRQIGFAVALGVFVGCSPAVGFHGGLAVGCATVLRLNRLWAFLGSRTSAFFVLPLITYAEVQTAHHLRTGEWITLDRARVLEHGTELLADWFLGMIPVGGALATALGFLAYAIADRRARARKMGATESR
jgi:uncharacterized protein (DUF2062 family)